MTYRIYFDEFCPEFVEWLRNKFRIMWIHWFMDLSADRQEKFAAWVMENYHGVDRRIKMMKGGDQ